MIRISSRRTIQANIPAWLYNAVYLIRPEKPASGQETMLLSAAATHASFLRGREYTLAIWNVHKGKKAGVSERMARHTLQTRPHLDPGICQKP